MGDFYWLSDAQGCPTFAQQSLCLPDCSRQCMLCGAPQTPLGWRVCQANVLEELVAHLHAEVASLRIQLMTPPTLQSPPHSIDLQIAQMVLEDCWQYSISGIEQMRPGHIVAIGNSKKLLRRGSVNGINLWDRCPRLKITDPAARKTFTSLMVHDGMQIVDGDGTLVASNFFAASITSKSKRGTRAECQNTGSSASSTSEYVSGGSGTAAAEALSSVPGSIVFKVSADGGIKEFRSGRLWRMHCGSRQPPGKFESQQSRCRYGYGWHWQYELV